MRNISANSSGWYGESVLVLEKLAHGVQKVATLV